ncbi:SCO family protein [Lysobacter firmicutimachus]|uniref:SCO family protein n=1 Tax=Lysobacter firmicutimachus TaxID=1792846 RepID=A0AAU8MX12_9GAMM
MRTSRIDQAAAVSALRLPVPIELSARRRILAGLACAGLLSACGGQRPLSLHGINLTGRDFARDFQLLDPQGRERRLAEFRGRPVLLFFGFTQCPDVCPTALTRAVQIRKLLGAQGERLQVIFVTLDPERDTPSVLDTYVRAFDPGFLGLYGDAERTARTAKDFRVVYAKVPTGASYTIDHSALSYVFDAEGALRIALRHEQSAQHCVDDIRQIL